MNRKISFSLAVALLLVAVTVTFSITMVLAMRMFDNTITSVAEKETMFSNLSEIDTYVSSEEYYDYSFDTVYDTVASGYILGVSDRYARYYTAKAYTEYQSVLSGKVMGIGVDIIKDAATGYARVLRVYEETPAAEAGITKNCYITSITVDDTVYDVKNLSDAAAINSRLRGEDGTTVTLSYLQPDGAQIADVTLTHRSYMSTTVDSMLLGGVCGYIRVRTFDHSTAGEIDTALSDLQSQGARAIVFDLRDNDGGSLEHALPAIDRVVGPGPIALKSDKAGNQTALHISDETKCPLPMVCLVNGNTASGAEVFAACVRQMEKGSVVGGRTAGRGAIQSTPQRMSNGSAVSVTVGMLMVQQTEDEWVTFEGDGILPDMAASLTAAEEQNYYDLTPESDSQIQMAANRACTMAGVNYEPVADTESPVWDDDAQGEEPEPVEDIPAAGGEAAE